MNENEAWTYNKVQFSYICELPKYQIVRGGGIINSKNTHKWEIK